MSARGVFFAITIEQGDALYEALGTDEALMDLIEEIEEAWDENWLAECDKSWDALHRLLTDGKLAYGNGVYPLNHCVLGPRQLYEGVDYIVSLVAPEEVADIAVALVNITRESFDNKYRTVVPKDYAPEYGDQDLEYTWEWFQLVRDLYVKAATEGRAMIFTVDQ